MQTICGAFFVNEIPPDKWRSARGRAHERGDSRRDRSFLNQRAKQRANPPASRDSREASWGGRAGGEGWGAKKGEGER